VVQIVVVAVEFVPLLRLAVQRLAADALDLVVQAADLELRS
jgi:hypothetical protein